MSNYFLSLDFGPPGEFAVSHLQSFVGSKYKFRTGWNLLKTDREYVL